MESRLFLFDVGLQSSSFLHGVALTEDVMLLSPSWLRLRESRAVIIDTEVAIMVSLQLLAS